jgi:rhodanese-related sulfurtransferase
MTKLLTFAVAVDAALSALPLAGSAHAAAADLAKLQTLAQTIARNEDHVTAAALNDMIIKNQHNFTLVDVRSQDDYQAGHIKGAINVPLAKLFNNDELQRLSHAARVVLYSNGTDQAAQAAVLLRIAGVSAVSLAGGFDYWAEHTMNLPAATGGEKSPDAAKRAAIIRALNDCPPLPEAKIPPLRPVSAAPAPAPAPPKAPPTPAAPKSSAPVILPGACG